MRQVNWQILREAALDLTRQGRTPFTRKELIEKVHEQDPDISGAGLNCMISKASVNSTARPYLGVKYKLFYKVGKGLYELYDPEKHGSKLKS